MRINGKKGRTLMEGRCSFCKGLVWLSYVRIRKTVENLGYCGQDSEHNYPNTGLILLSSMLQRDRGHFICIVLVAAVFQIIQSIRAA